MNRGEEKGHSHKFIPYSNLCTHICFVCLVQIRMQAEYRSGTTVVRKGMIHSFVSMFKEEGARGLYRVICKDLALHDDIVKYGLLMKHEVKMAGY